MKKLWLILILAVLAGCVFRQSDSSLDGLDRTHSEDARALASEAADVLSKREAPAHIALNLQPAPGPFGEAFEAELRTRGYALRENGLAVSYTADVLGDQAFVQVSCADGQRFSLTRKLGLPVQKTITEPPNTRPVRDEHPLEVKDLPESAPEKQENSPTLASTAALPTSAPIPAQKAPDPMPLSAPLSETKLEQEALNSKEKEPVAIHQRPPVRMAKVLAAATAREVAKRNHLPVEDFCAWNQVGASAILSKGYEVYLSAPPAGSIPTAAPVPVPVGVAALEAKAESKASVAESTSPEPQSQPTNMLAAPATAQVSLASQPEQTIQPIPAPVQTVQPRPEQISPKLHLDSPKVSLPPNQLEAKTEIPPAESPSGPVVAETVSASSPGSVLETVFVTAEPSFEISKGRRLRDQLSDWASQAGYSLVWKARNDYELQSSARFQGDFIGAVREFFAALASNGLALRVTIYQGNNVMEVSEN